MLCTYNCPRAKLVSQPVICWELLTYREFLWAGPSVGTSNPFLSSLCSSGSDWLFDCVKGPDTFDFWCCCRPSKLATLNSCHWSLWSRCPQKCTVSDERLHCCRTWSSNHGLTVCVDVVLWDQCTVWTSGTSLKWYYRQLLAHPEPDQRQDRASQAHAWSPSSLSTRLLAMQSLAWRSHSPLSSLQFFSLQ